MKAKTWILLLLFIVALSCNEKHVNDTLALTVVDGAGAPITGAIVRLYASEDDYGKDIVKESFTTNNQGRVSTTNADYSVGTFYAEALMGTLRNWPATTVKGGTNDYKLILADNNVYNELVGQHWNLTDVTIGGTSVFSNVSACSKDNFLLFKKDLKVTFSEGNSICSGQTATIEQTYLPPIKGNASALGKEIVKYLIAMGIAAILLVIAFFVFYTIVLIIEGIVQMMDRRSVRKSKPIYHISGDYSHGWNAAVGNEPKRPSNFRVFWTWLKAQKRRICPFVDVTGLASNKR
jgi:hypothetical protein